LPSATVLRVCGSRLTLETGGVVVESQETDDPFAWIEAFQARFRCPEIDNLPRFSGGLVGYFGYDTVRYVEKRVAGSAPPDSVGTPDILLMLSEEVVVFDNLRGKLSILVYADPAVDGAYERAQTRLEELSERLRQPVRWECVPAGRALAEE